MSSGYRQPEPPRAEDFYDFLEGLCSRVPWKDEEEKLKYTALLRKLRAVNIFGYMATKITTQSDEETE